MNIQNENQSNVTLGFSPKINDPEIQKVVKKINSSGMVFTLVLAVIAVIAFAIAGEMEVGGFENPSATFMGLGLGGLLLLIAIIQKVKSKMGKNWDGTIIDKKVVEPTPNQRVQGNYQTRYYLVIQEDNKKPKDIPTTEELLNYYNVGDRVRHHAGMSQNHILEKYDKTHDTTIYCIACSSRNDIANDNCSRCKCPLLK